jgi:hypothetical protein
VTPEQWQAQLQTALVNAGVVKALGGALTTAALRAQRAAVLSLSGSGAQRTGRLQQSIRGSVRAVGDKDAEIVVQAGGQLGGAAVRYAAAQEYGGTIRPKKARYLAMPIHPKTITPAGVSIYASPRDVPEKLAFVEGVDGEKFLLNAKGEAYYMLFSSVTLKPRRYLRTGRDEALRKLGPDIGKALVKLIKPGGTSA